ncbi:flippase-like domain-containing protein [bacterium]|nr:flippase-like domain-containing protein [bacterium]
MSHAPRQERQEESSAAYLPVRTARGSRWVRLALLLGIIAFAAIFLFADPAELWSVLTHADPWLLALPVVFMLLSYVTMARSYQGIALAAGCQVPLFAMLKITFVANSMNYLVSTGGLSGFAVRMFFFTRRGVSSQTAVLISLAQTFLTNCMLLLFLLVGFAYVFTSHSLTGSALAVTTVLLVLFLIAAVLAALLLFHARLRRRTLFRLAQAAHWLLHRFSPQRAPARTHIWRYQFNLNRGISFLLARRRAMVQPLIYIALDWLLTILVLYAAFLAVHYPIALSHVIVGFAVGIVLSFASLIPGGLGVMEGSMAAVFASMQVPFETAVIAVLLFRVAYYLLPLLISLFFLHGMFVQGTAVSTEIAPPPATSSR